MIKVGTSRRTRVDMTFLAVLLLSCPGCWKAPAPKVFTLPSGKQIKVLGVGTIHFISGNETALQLKYETQIPVDDQEALEQEINEIWPVFRGDVEKSGLEVAIISAMEPATGSGIPGFSLSSSKARNYVLTRSGDGKWVLPDGRTFDSEELMFAVATAITSLRNEEFAALASAFHYPPEYSEAQLMEERAAIERELRFVSKAFGKFGDLLPPDPNLRFLGIEISAGDPAYWRRKPNQGRDGGNGYRVEYARGGSGALVVTLFKSEAGWRYRSIGFNLEESQPDARRKITAIAERMSAELGSEIHGELPAAD